MSVFNNTSIATCLMMILGFGLSYSQNIQPLHSASQAYATYADRDIDALFSNQAGLASIHRAAVMASAMQRYGGDGIAEFHLGAGIAIDDYMGAGVFGRRLGDEVYNEQTFGIAAGRQLFQNLSIGLAMEYYQLSIEGYGQEGQFNVQLGMQADLSKAVRIGTHLSLPLANEDALSYSNQAVINVDIAVDVDDHLALKGGVRKMSDRDPGFKIALNYQPVEALILHAGVLTNPSWLSFGVGLELFDNFEIFAGGGYQQDLGWSPGLNLTFHL